jgi:hypothetical protein
MFSVSSLKQKKTILKNETCNLGFSDTPQTHFKGKQPDESHKETKIPWMKSSRNKPTATSDIGSTDRFLNKSYLLYINK